MLNAFTALGHVVRGRCKRTRLLHQALKPFYRAVFSARSARVVSQNADGQDRLVKLSITDAARALLISCSGVDIDHFKPVELAGMRPAWAFQSLLQLLFPSRLINEGACANRFMHASPSGPAGPILSCS